MCYEWRTPGRPDLSGVERPSPCLPVMSNVLLAFGLPTLLWLRLEVQGYALAKTQPAPVCHWFRVRSVAGALAIACFWGLGAAHHVLGLARWVTVVLAAVALGALAMKLVATVRVLRTERLDFHSV